MIKNFWNKYYFCEVLWGTKLKNLNRNGRGIPTFLLKRCKMSATLFEPDAGCGINTFNATKFQSEDLSNYFICSNVQKNLIELIFLSHFFTFHWFLNTIWTFWHFWSYLAVFDKTQGDKGVAKHIHGKSILIDTNLKSYQPASQN